MHTTPGHIANADDNHEQKPIATQDTEGGQIGGQVIRRSCHPNEERNQDIWKRSNGNRANPPQSTTPRDRQLSTCGQPEADQQQQADDKQPGRPTQED